jgi:CubicO group peptidase (beta-lactamase class C family)
MRRSHVFFAALTVLLTVTSAIADESFEFPSGRPGQIAREYFTAFTAGEDAMREYVANFRDRSSLERMSVDQRIAQYLQIREVMGNPILHSVLESGANSLALLVRSEDGASWFRFDFTVQESIPFKLASMRIEAATSPEATAIVEWTSLADLLSQTCDQRGIPAMAAALIEGNQIVESAAAGVRAKGGGDAVEIDDRFHVGSVTKSMTATLVADLIEDGLMDWDTTVGELLPDLEMLEAYRTVTVSQLLRHRGGVQAYTILSDEDEKRLSALPGTPTERRAGFVAEALAQDPVGPAGTFMSYSNAGFALLGLMAETAAGSAWEELMRQRVFGPLEMVTADFGWPATPQRPAQPRGHFGTPPDLRVQSLDEFSLGDYLAPAGDVSCSIEDLARFAMLHLQGLQGIDGLLSAATIRRLHDPGPHDDPNRYGGGWMISEAPSGELCHWHGGSAGTFYSMVWLLPESNRAGVVLMNSGAPSNDSLAREVLSSVLGK